MTITDISQTQEIYTVSRLNREVRFLLEGSFPSIWIEGEISNFAAPNSGHWYFSLKDALAQVRCAMFRPQNRKLGFTPKDGTHVLVKARISLYEGRGEFQLLIEHLEEAGEGRLRQQFEALKKRLLEAGLFDSARKKPIPTLPKSLGVITSPTGAAIRDILSVLNRRFPCVPIIIYPTLVQGESAAPNIVKAIQTANRRNECDAIILARGGGSLEDLWPFNEEIVAHAIYRSTIPIVSGVGHEIDFTIADFVADLRAPTPSAAAELTTPDQQELLESINQDEKQLARLMKQKLQHLQQHLDWTKKHLQQQHPKRRLTEQAQQLDLNEAVLIRLQNKLITQHQSNLQILHAKLSRYTPTHRIRELRHQLHIQQQNMQNFIAQSLQHHQKSLATLSGKLDALSPLATLKRGFAIATTANQKVLRKAKEICVGDKINVKLMEGELGCRVENIIDC